MLPIRAARRWSIPCMLMSFSGDGSKFKAGGGGLDDQKSKQAKKRVPNGSDAMPLGLGGAEWIVNFWLANMR